MRIVDRYLIRQVVVPFGIGLLIFTFLLIIPVLMRSAEQFIAKGVPTELVVRMMAQLIPQALGQTIPMSLLVGLLVAFGRLSADREFVALQACGVSPARLMRPVLLLSGISALATGYVLLVGVPNANQSFREIEFSTLATYAENEVKPRTFYDRFPGLVLYVRDTPPAGGWTGVFVADDRPAQGGAIYLARAGRVVADREKRTLEMALDYGTRHTTTADGRYEVSTFERQVISLDAAAVMPETQLEKGDREMSVPELRAKAAELTAQGIFPHNQLFEIHKKYSIPFACLVFGLIGLALGASNRRDGSMASFVIGIGVIFSYFVLLWFGQSVVRGQLIPPWLAAWQPNIVLGVMAIALFMWRGRVADQPLRLPMPAFMTRLTDLVQAGPRTRRWLPIRVLDWYVALTYLKVFGLAVAALGGVFYIATFIDLSEKVFKGDATWAMLAAFFWYITPQYAYYILPLSTLVATLVTVALLTKSSELVAMKACGISVYRVAAPMLVGATLVAGALFRLDQTVLGPSNRQAETLSNTMRGRVSRTVDLAMRRWLTGPAGEVYHFDGIDLANRQIHRLSVVFPTDDMGRVTRRLFAERATFAGRGSDPTRWTLTNGWARGFDDTGTSRDYRPFTEQQEVLVPVTTLTLEPPDPEFMTYSELAAHTSTLLSTGIDVVAQQVALARKVAFPFVAIVMTLIGVPFAVTIGRNGAMAGIGAAIALGIVYWVTLSVFGAFGTGGALEPLIAAWAPNVLFGMAALYLLFAVRT